MAFSIHVLDSVNNVNVPGTVSAYRYCYLGQVITKSNKNINVTAKKCWPASCSTSASSIQRTTIVINKFRASHFVYNIEDTHCETTVALGLQQLWSDAKSNRRQC